MGFFDRLIESLLRLAAEQANCRYARLKGWQEVQARARKLGFAAAQLSMIAIAWWTLGPSAKTVPVNPTVALIDLVSIWAPLGAVVVWSFYRSWAELLMMLRD